MSRVVVLAPHERPPGRAFADPDLVTGDCIRLIGLIRDLHAAPESIHGGPGRDRLITTAAGRSYGDAPVSIVGFFGERRAEGCPSVAAQVEKVNADMIEGFDAFPLLLGYVSRKLDDEFNYVNLVVLRGADGIEKWRDVPQHVTAVTDLAPRFYNSVRIYNGSLPGGLSCAEQLQLRVVKYWDYRKSTVWQAMRTLSPSS